MFDIHGEIEQKDHDKRDNKFKSHSIRKSTEKIAKTNEKMNITKKIFKTEENYLSEAMKLEVKRQLSWKK